ncbi:SAM domain (Sterile alpha motif) [compost metagenome]
MHREKLHQLLVKRVDTWTESDVGVWLTTIDFARYVELFRSQEIDGSALLILDKAELEKIGVTKVGPKVKLWNAIETLRQINQKM